MEASLLKVDELLVPPTVGQYYLVPCARRLYDIVHSRCVRHWIDEDGRRRESEEVITKRIMRHTPIINHPHNDVENGQREVHYHSDLRFEAVSEDDNIFPFFGRVEALVEIVYLVMRCVTTEQDGITPVNLIQKSKLKHDCIHKGKCPHRGYDLNTVEPINGVITCPLHGLQFDANTLKLIK